MSETGFDVNLMDSNSASSASGFKLNTTSGIRTFVYFRISLRFALRSPFLGRTTDNMRNLIISQKAFKLRMQEPDSFEDSSGPCLQLLQDDDASLNRAKRQRRALLDQNCSPT